eukprot:SAG31_NODE_1022_length_10309_cov_9.623874_1_plen_352_part_10
MPSPRPPTLSLRAPAVRQPFALAVPPPAPLLPATPAAFLPPSPPSCAFPPLLFSLPPLRRRLLFPPALCPLFSLAVSSASAATSTTSLAAAAAAVAFFLLAVSAASAAASSASLAAASLAAAAVAFDLLGCHRLCCALPVPPHVLRRFPPFPATFPPLCHFCAASCCATLSPFSLAVSPTSAAASATFAATSLAATHGFCCAPGFACYPSLRFLSLHFLPYSSPGLSPCSQPTLPISHPPFWLALTRRRRLQVSPRSADQQNKQKLERNRKKKKSKKEKKEKKEKKRKKKKKKKKKKKRKKKGAGRRRSRSCCGVQVPKLLRGPGAKAVAGSRCRWISRVLLWVPVFEAQKR